MIDANKTDDSGDPLEQAAGWHLRLSESPESAFQFQRWHDACPEHARAWERIQRTLGALDLIEAASQSCADNTPESSSVIRRIRMPRSALALAACLFLLLTLNVPRLTLRLQADYLTVGGEVSSVVLPDGSEAVLSPQSAIAVDYADGVRQVRLIEGKVFFSVVRDSAHPFIVHSEQTQVRVLGTRFEVDEEKSGVVVSVERGHVRVSDPAMGAAQELLQGDRLRLDRQAGGISRTHLDSDSIASWRDGYLYVDNRSVAEVLAELERYSQGWILITDPALGERRISGVFDLKDTDRALKGLARSLSVSTHQLTPWVTSFGTF